MLCNIKSRKEKLVGSALQGRLFWVGNNEFPPMYSRAWVGWALAEQMSGHIDVVNQIYQLTKQLFPYDAFIALFAADFYLCEKKPQEAREYIQNTIQKLKEIEDVSPQAYEALNQKLVEIDHFK